MEAEHTLEEGELSDDCSNHYTPLQRPSNYSVDSVQSRFPVQKDSESEEELSTESDSDSDSALRRVKKPRIKLKPRPLSSLKAKKYDIWSTRVQEDVLSETLIGCDVTRKDRSRAVESYDYTLGAKYYKNCDDSNREERKNNKRTASDRHNSQLRHVRKRSSSREGKSKVKGASRNILALSVTCESSNEEIAKDIANKLCEEKEDLIFKVVTVFGKERTMEVFEETRKVEEDGGLLIMNQTRRRTPGGVFLFLVRHNDHITPEEKDKIFSEDRHREKVLFRHKQKQKLQKLKNEIDAARTNLLPDILTRTEILTSKSNRSREQTEIKDVINPPPTPETDCHENSCDGMDSLNPVHSDQMEKMEVPQRKVESYDDDFLDIGCSHTMDLF